MFNDLSNRIKNIPQAVKASIALFLSSVITKGISYITTPIFTRLLTPEEYGQVSVYLTWVQLFGIIAMFCLSYGVFNNGMVDYPDKRDEFSFSLLVLSNVFTLAFTGIIVALYPIISKFLDIDIPLIILMCISFFFQPAYSFWATKQRYELKYKWNVVWSIICAVVSPLFAILMIVSNKSGSGNVYPRIFGAEVSLIVIYIGFYIYLAVKSKLKINVKYWKFAIIFNLPLIPHYLSTYLLNSSDKLMISYLINDEATALYSIAYSVASVAMIIWTAINSSLVPYTYEKCKDEDYKSIGKAAIPLVSVFAGGCILVIMLAPEVVRIMATDVYMEGIYAIPPIVGGVFFQIQYFLYSNILYYYKKPYFVMIGSIVSVILNIILNYIFIPQFGYIAAGYTTLFCYAVQAAIDFTAMRLSIKKKIYNLPFMLFLSGAVTIIAIFSVFLYDYPIIRFSIIGLIIISCVIFAKRIIGIISTIKNK